MLTQKKWINPIVEHMKPSGIRRFFDMMDTMENVISLTVGEPDFVTPKSIREAAIHALEDGKTHYTSNAGLAKLREEIGAYLSRRFDLHYDPEQEIIVTVGASEGIDASLRTLISPGDEVIVHEPNYVSYEPLIELCQGVPVVLNTKAENRFRITKEELAQCITPKTKALILVYPNNPTGAIMEQQDLEEIAPLLQKEGIFVITDEIYAELTYNGKKHVSIASLPGMRDLTILISGFSKAFAMTGWRMGYMAAPAPIMKQLLKIHQYAIMCSPTVSQYGAIEAMQHCQKDAEAMIAEYDTRRKLITGLFRDMGLPVFEPEGAFYIFPDIRSTGMTSEEFCADLLEKQHVAMVPGTAFGDCGEGFVRVSYASSVQNIQEACKRIRLYLETIRK